MVKIMNDLLQNILNSTDVMPKNDYPTYSEVKNSLDAALDYSLRCVCVYPRFVKWAKTYCGKRVKICALINRFDIGFYPAVSLVRECIRGGADEIEFSASLCELKSGNIENLINETRSITRSSRGRTAKLNLCIDKITEEELSTLLLILPKCSVDYVVLGDNTSPAPKEKIEKITETIGKKIKIKLIGNYSLEDCFNFFNLGISRFSSDNLINELKLAKM